MYKCDNYYHPESEGGVIFNDPTFSINWGLPVTSMIVSKRDMQSPLFSETEIFF